MRSPTSDRRRQLLRFALATATLVLPTCGEPASAAPPELAITQFGIETWTPEIGLAGSWVRAIAQDRDGFLWLGTSGGLSRFDGRTFVNLTAARSAEMPSNAVNALALAADGRLWVGFAHGGVRFLSGGRFGVDRRLDALSTQVVRSLLPTDDGMLWIGTDEGLWAAGPRGVERIRFLPDVPILAIRLVAAADGSVWVRTRSNGLWRIHAGTVHREPDAPDCTGLDLVLAAGSQPITACVNGVWERRPDPVGWVRLSTVTQSYRLLRDRTGALWFGSRSGLTRLSSEHGEEHLPLDRGIADWRTRALFEDDRGDLWVGTFSGGLSRLRRGAVLAFGPSEGLEMPGTTAVLATPDDRLWVGTNADGLFRWRRGERIAEHWTAANGLPSDRVMSLALDRRIAGRLWVGTDRGIVTLDAGTPHPVERPDGMSADEVLLLYADPAAPGTIWASRPGGGLDEIRDGAVRPHDERNGLRAGLIRALHRDRRGNLLAAGEGGIFRLDGGRWSVLPLPEIALRSIRAIAEEKDGTLWIASETMGLLRWSNGALARLGEREGLPFTLIFSLELDRDDGLWISGNEGLLRLRLDDFDEWARGERDILPISRLASRDGLRDRECNGWGLPAATSFADGTLVYPTITGIALADPAGLPASILRPMALYVDRAETGGRELDPRGPWTLGANERDLRVRFGAREFVRPESLRFRYRLDGSDADWIAAGDSLEAIYSHLRPGSYRFRLQARLPGQSWVEAPGPSRVEVVPKLSESTAIRALALALVVATAGSLVSWRMRLERRHAAALGRERTFLRAVIDTSPNLIFAKRRDHTYSMANRAAAALHGLVPGDLEGRSDVELDSRAEGLERLSAVDDEVVAARTERIVPEAVVVDAAGERRWLRVVKRPLLGPGGEVEQILGTAVDITDFKSAERLLMAQEAELRTSREELRRLARRLLSAQEEERRNLAREIHDDLTQQLAGLAMLAGGLSHALEQGQPVALDRRLAELGRELERLASDTQAISRELHPSLLEHLGLEEALRSECATFGRRTGLRIDFTSRGLPADLPSETSIALYRVAQEALRNVVAHSGAAEARVRLVADGSVLLLEVEDSGAGFDPRKRAPGPGLGLTSIAERTRLVGAELAIDSLPGRGTRLSVRVPLA